MKKALDAIQWMRERRRQIDQEDRDLTWAEKSRKTHQIVLRDPELAKLCGRVLRPEQLRPLAARERETAYRNGRKAASRPRS